mmetsp:Transcript_33268/g.43862  ORF Transcript_33268/g.43862 Transcript_33268/m.43862 type:complete len:619 (-) Transcript_33268:201-2057(-)
MMAPRRTSSCSTVSFSQYEQSEVLWKDDVLFTEESHKWYRYFNIIIYIFLLIPVTLGIWGYMNNPSLDDECFFDSVSVSNLYSLNSTANSTAFDKTYPWLEDKLLAEPFRESTFNVKGKRYFPETSQILWAIQDEHGNIVGEMEGDSPSFTFTKPSTFFVTVIEQSEAGEELQRLSSTVIVKYIRREIRSLHEEDLNTLLDTMKILWELPQTEGEQLYGEKYISMQELLIFHLKFSADRECDHMHAGYGFLTQHSALTNLFEQSLQSIDPSISLPYWDYFQDIEDFEGNEGTFLHFMQSSKLFSKKYFGATDPETGYIKDGRWKGLQVPNMDLLSDLEQESIPHDIYNFLRSPWSANSDPHITRISSTCDGNPTTVFEMPNCKALNKLMKASSVDDFLKYIAYDPQETIHVLTGGVSGCGEAYDNLLAFMDEETVDIHRAKSFIYHKNGYRNYYIECDSDHDGCHCKNQQALYSSESEQATFFKALGIDGWKQYNAEARKALVKTICESDVHIGDNLQSSSSYTPEFWFMNPTLERAFQKKVLKYPFADFSYPDDSSWQVNGDCKGHGANDIVLYATQTLTVLNEPVMLTNSEMLKILNPQEGLLPYLYDSLEWSYCF